ncbi:MAG: lasso RiPP family leader peptide-containing protein [Egibacteraceae bacterium]
MTDETLNPTAYEPPVLVDLGEVQNVTLGSQSEDTADMDKAMYN